MYLHCTLTHTQGALYRFCLENARGRYKLIYGTSNLTLIDFHMNNYSKLFKVLNSNLNNQPTRFKTHGDD